MQSSSQEQPPQPSETEPALSLLQGDRPTSEHPSNVVAMPVEMYDRLDRIMVQAQAA